jgi:hypothetical protein
VEERGCKRTAEQGLCSHCVDRTCEFGVGGRVERMTQVEVNCVRQNFCCTSRDYVEKKVTNIW